jgi:alginate O-acetyltransferase complex protein AlgI
MLFNSWIFIGAFLPITLVVYRLLGLLPFPRLPLVWLTLASLFFYGWWNVNYVPLLLASIVANYLLGLRLAALASEPGSRLRRPLLFAGVAANLLLLGYYKYSVFVLENVGALTGVDFGIRALALPLAISFYTFLQIAYLVDTSEGDGSDHSFLEYCLFVTFFPHLIAGPLVHHKELIPQFTQAGGARAGAWSGVKFNHEEFAQGLTFFIVGLCKKVLLADPLAEIATPVFAASSTELLTASEAWTGALAYTLQLYFDFSGYSDMAVGLALLFGVKLPYNFASPYKAVSIIDFWRRWHITLSRFLRNYLYVRLGGSRRGKNRQYVNLLTTMILGGLWHGAGWTFLIWGTLHGVFLMINHLWRALCGRLGVKIEDTATSRWASRALTFLCVTVAWVFFRAESVNGAFAMLQAMAGLNGLTGCGLTGCGLTGSDIVQQNADLGDLTSLQNQIMIGILLLVAFCAPNSQEWIMGSGRERRASAFAEWRPGTIYAGVLAACFLFALTRLSAVSEFIYFNF